MEFKQRCCHVLRCDVSEISGYRVTQFQQWWVRVFVLRSLSYHHQPSSSYIATPPKEGKVLRSTSAIHKSPGVNKASPHTFTTATGSYLKQMKIEIKIFQEIVFKFCKIVPKRTHNVYVVGPQPLRVQDVPGALSSSRGQHGDPFFTPLQPLTHKRTLPTQTR